MQQNTKLGLGGHSFIRELGNDPEASFEEQCVIVGACLDNGIRWIDTTYYQERVALGNVLQALPGRRTEARITAWNFFRQPGKEDQLVGFTQYDPDSLSNQLAELQTEYLDLLVIHSRDDKDTLYKEIELATAWRDAGRVREVGLGMAQLRDLDALPTGHPFTHVLAPYNAFNTGATETFRESKARGLSTIAMSPFVRGWNLDKAGVGRAKLAALLLRWVTSQETVDTVFVSIRKTEWILANLRAEQAGTLSDDEATFVQEAVGHSA